MVKFTGCSLEDAIRSATATPAKAVRVYGKKGVLSVGADADFVVLKLGEESWDFEISRVFVRGEEAILI
jgi:N-acetylglucosamine-6-phosphate deacetylase